VKRKETRRRTVRKVRRRVSPCVLHQKIPGSSRDWEMRLPSAKLLKLFPEHIGGGNCSDDEPNNFITCPRCSLLVYGKVDVSLTMKAEGRG